MAYHWYILPSRHLTILVRCVYGLALLACFMNALTFFTQSLLALFVIFHGLRCFKTADAWQLFYNDEDGWQMAVLNIQNTITILPSTVVTRQIIFLHYQLNEKKAYRMITKDAIVSDAHNYRQLIVALKTCT
ncbi:MAG: hypothetical protein RLZZ384_899 [Pseudomonadota bacterium]